MNSWILLTLCVACKVNAQVDPAIPPLPTYCTVRTPTQCCSGRDDECTMPITRGPHSSLCYCDEFCWQHQIEDCCPDYQLACRSRPSQEGSESLIDNQCLHKGQYYELNSRLTIKCNKRVCTERYDSTQTITILYWLAEEDSCVNDEDLISTVNQGNAGWKAKPYQNFESLKLKDALKLLLGTAYPKEQVIGLLPMKANVGLDLPETFDSREKWPGLINKPLNQGRCGASWAFSTIGVASDRWGIQSPNSGGYLLSTQHLISCNWLLESPCDESTLAAAWWVLQQYGAVSDACVPYQYSHGSNITNPSGCLTGTATCPNGDPAEIYRTTPSYRISPNEEDIMHEIFNQGPVQAVVKVKPDLFVYESGIYDSLENIDSSSGTHSVRIIGWGVEDGVKYWLVANSWGEDWGEGGYFRIKRGVNESGIEDFVVGVWISRMNSVG